MTLERIAERREHQDLHHVYQDHVRGRSECVSSRIYCTARQFVKWVYSTRIFNGKGQNTYPIHIKNKLLRQLGFHRLVLVFSSFFFFFKFRKLTTATSKELKTGANV
jgi:hypothetical protein